MSADPFEVRVKFSGMLQKLPASTGPMTKAALFFLKHPDQHEDLHSCILENIDEVRACPSRLVSNRTC